jgi:hypothetical protein
MKVLINRVSKLEKLKEAKMQVAKLLTFSNGTEHYGIKKRIQRSNSILVIMLCGFQREISHT